MPGTAPVLECNRRIEIVVVRQLASVLTHDEARRIAANISKLPVLLSRKPRNREA